MTQYKNKKTKKVGTVVHYKGSTTTLRFDDNTELILSSYNLRNDWIRVKDEKLDKFLGKKNKVDYTQFVKIMKENALHNPNVLEGVIVYSNSNFYQSYPEISRSYVVTSDSPYFNGGTDLIGNCLDKTEYEVGLDMYNWKVDYCYFTDYYVNY